MNSEFEIPIYLEKKHSKQCRICLRENIEDSECVFDERESSTIASMIMSCARVQVASQDGLPDIICAQCLGDLEVANNFRLRCELSDSLLRKFYCDQGDVPEPEKARRTQSPVKEEVNTADCSKYESEDNIDSDGQSDQLVDISPDELTEVQSDVATNTSNQETNIEADALPSKLERSEENASNSKAVSRNTRSRLNCTRCTFSCNLQNQMVAHFSTHLRKNKFYCDVCQLRFPSLHKMKIHREMCISKKAFKCEFCQASFINHTYFKVHKIICKKKKPKSQLTCSEKLDAVNDSDSPNALKSQETDKSEAKPQVIKPYNCVLCNVQFSSPRNLVGHTKLKHYDLQPRQFDKLYKTNTSYEPLKYTCEMCGKQLHSRQTLQVHIKRHLNIRDFACEFCGRTFVDKSERDMHAKLHTDPKKHLCDICGFKTRTKPTLIAHLLTHQEEKNFKCELCPYKCNGKYKLKLHMGSHSDERKFSCPKCDAKFKRNSHINKHMQRIHKIHYRVGDYSDRRYIK